MLLKCKTMKTFIYHLDINWIKFDLNLGILIDTKVGQFYTFDAINTDRDCITGFFHPKEKKLQ